MAELTLEALAERVTTLESAIARIRLPEPIAARTRNWRSVVGMFAGDELMKRIDELGRQIRQADREEHAE